MKKFNTIACALFALVSSTHIEAMPIHEAVLKNDVSALQEALKAGTDVNEKDGYGATPLHLAARDGHYNAMRVLLKSGANVDEPGNRGKVALIHAIHSGSNQCLELLLQYGANVNYNCNLPLLTPLILAARLGKYECVKTLLAYGADVNKRDRYGNRALVYAAKAGFEDCAQILSCAANHEQETQSRYEEYIGEGGLATVIGLIRDWQTPVEPPEGVPAQELYEEQCPQAWWKMPFIICSGAGIKGTDIQDIDEWEIPDDDWSDKATQGESEDEDHQ